MEREEKIDRLIVDRCGRENPFNVPGNYFSGLHANVSREITLKKFSGNAFFVPENYWNDLTNQVQARLAIESDKQNGFSLPEKYFDSLEQRILAKNKLQKKQLVVHRIFAGNAWKYATAACIMLALSITFWARQATDYSVQNELSNLPANDIELYLQENTNLADMNMLIENIDHDLHMNVSSAQIDRKTLTDYIETQL